MTSHLYAQGSSIETDSVRDPNTFKFIHSSTADYPHGTFANISIGYSSLTKRLRLLNLYFFLFDHLSVYTKYHSIDGAAWFEYSGMVLGELGGLNMGLSYAGIELDQLLYKGSNTGGSRFNGIVSFSSGDVLFGASLGYLTQITSTPSRWGVSAGGSYLLHTNLRFLFDSAFYTRQDDFFYSHIGVGLRYFTSTAALDASVEYASKYDDEPYGVSLILSYTL